MLGDLFEEHRLMKVRGEELFDTVRRVPRVRLDEITQLRVRIASISMAHLRTEDELIIKPLLASGRMDEIPGAAEIIAHMRQAHRDYSVHVGRWTLQAMEGDWEGYVRAIAPLIEDMHATMAREEELLYRPALKLLAEGRASRAG